MKPLQIVAIVCAASLALEAGAAPTETQQLLTDAQTAFVRGDFDTAKTNFEMVRQIDPRNQVAIGYLRMIKAKEAARSKGSDKEKQLAALIIPRVEFREATLGSALEYLKKAAEKNSQGKIAVNFVVQLPEEKVQKQTVTLNLTNVPFTEVLKYLGGLAGLTFEYDQYAIIVKPAAAPATTTTAELTPPAQ